MLVPSFNTYKNVYWLSIIGACLNIFLSSLIRAMVCGLFGYIQTSAEVLQIWLFGTQCMEIGRENKILLKNCIKLVKWCLENLAIFYQGSVGWLWAILCNWIWDYCGCPADGLLWRHYALLTSPEPYRHNGACNFVVRIWIWISRHRIWIGDNWMELNLNVRFHFNSNNGFII